MARLDNTPPVTAPVTIMGVTVSGPVSRRELAAMHIHARGCIAGCKGRRWSGEHKPPGQHDLDRADTLLADLDRLFG